MVAKKYFFSFKRPTKPIVINAYLIGVHTASKNPTIEIQIAGDLKVIYIKSREKSE